ncbi:Mur ligase family protein [Sphingomicrobium aestuariivivum]|uniref:Mur ligase family protein n=1 Tax=Sphingomicrobium aestuariivivum TaxID=1582356 RepID=UPI001FD6C189|nr:UDP-N-acetylmuramoyl-L-alanine--D-glutamate ligase [Sphingomicrobium aestuariivivum]MCJ8190657.1 Mur ligase family protein [Sphingomicrobium aestuariivivum]
MILSEAWQGRKYAVYGLARSGLATVSALVRSGCEVACWDDNEEARGRANPFAKRVDFVAEGLAGYDSLVVSPGVPINTHVIAEKAREAGCEIIGDVELFARARGDLPRHVVVGITGTNGKSTTTALIDHILREAKVPSVAAGNIGEPILSLDPLPEGGAYVLELSSYQIDLTQGLDCEVAVLLNITPDHLDRYDGEFDKYVASKERLFAMQGGDSVAVDMREIDVPAGSEDWSPSLAGPHNAQNAAAAIIACSALGLTRDEIEKGLASFKGLAHRMERVAEKDGVAFVNDSKATNVDSVAPALAAFERIHWIAGGQAKSGDLSALGPHMGNIVRAYLVGDAQDLFAKALDGKVDFVKTGTIEQAVKEAAAAARPGDTVLLSPACASFDQFKDFEARGEAFRAAVEAL